jgi:hypothetical protein
MGHFSDGWSRRTGGTKLTKKVFFPRDPSFRDKRAVYAAGSPAAGRIVDAIQRDLEPEICAFKFFVATLWCSPARWK